MREYNNYIKLHTVRGKKHAHWAILTLDDLPRTNWKYSQLIAQFQARYKAAKELGEDKPIKKSED